MKKSASDNQPPAVESTFRRPDPYDFNGTMRFLRLGGNDPCFLRLPGEVITSVDSPDGPAVLRLVDGEMLLAQAWGPGAERAIAQAAGWLGLNDQPESLGHLHPVVAQLEKHNPGLRLPDTGDVFQGLLRTIPQQLVAWAEAAAAWGHMARALGRVAPAPGDRIQRDPALSSRRGGGAESSGVVNTRTTRAIPLKA